VIEISALVYKPYRKPKYFSLEKQAN